MVKDKSITYSQVGDNYDTKDPIKKLAQTAAAQTARYLKETFNYDEISDSRGESAFIWQVDGETFMASVIEGLGTKNLVADDIRTSDKTYYDVIGYDTVATIINDLVTSGAKPVVLHAYWAIEDNSWLQDEKRMKDLIQGWKEACDDSKVAWGGGETPTLKGIIKSHTVDLGGSAVGIIKGDKRRIRSEKLQKGDRILFLKSNGINANGISLARAVAEKLPEGYATKLPSGISFGEAVLTKTNIYSKLVQDLLDAEVELHYISNITGHGLRKVMRAPQDFTYIIERVFPISELFSFIQKHANLDDEEMYGTYNMGQDYVIFLPASDVKKAQDIISQNGFESLDAGYIEEGERKVIIKEKDIIYEGKTLDLR